MLYHFQLGFPETLKIKEQYTFNLIYSKHALQAANTDRYGEMKLPYLVIIPRDYIVEVETEDNIKVDKIVFRVPYEYKEDLDLCLVVVPDTHFVKTVWFNKITDTHTTLDKRKYSPLKSKE